mgnify:FL=1
MGVSMVHFDWIKRHAERTPNKLALVDAATGQELTYCQLDRRINRLASFLSRKFHLQRGARVSILAKNSASYYEILFACARTGAILNTLNWRLSAPELDYILQDCTPAVMIYEPEFAEMVEKLRPGLSADHFLLLGETAPAGQWSYAEALAQGEAQSFDGPRLVYDETWAIIYTSGTTGRPKGCLLYTSPSPRDS